MSAIAYESLSSTRVRASTATSTSSAQSSIVSPDGDPSHALTGVQTYLVPAGGGAVFETVFDKNAQSAASEVVARLVARGWSRAVGRARLVARGWSRAVGRARFRRQRMPPEQRRHC